jgi:hypothetical protein
MREAGRLGLDFQLLCWRAGDPPATAVLAHLESSGPRGTPAGQRDLGLTLKKTAKRLAILSDIVKTANSILEPRKVIELIMAKIQQLIPSEAWSMLMVDEEKQELAFELALGAKTSPPSGSRSGRGWRAGWPRRESPPS